MDDWIKAGRVAAEAREYGRNLIKVGASLSEVTDKIEQKIKTLGGSCAFPVQMSKNDIAAHYTALWNENQVFREGDLVKLDLGVHVNGAIGDTACSINLGNHQALIKASEEALANTLKSLRQGMKVHEIGKIIQTTIESHHFSPIKNLSGHGLNTYLVHDKPTIPNFDNNDKYILNSGFIAIEPFATSGVGYVTDGKPSEIYRALKIKPTRSADTRVILKFIQEEYQGMPFAKRWLMQRFDKLKVTLALNSLEKEGSIMQYSQLVEKEKGFVSQTEHSVAIGEKIKILTA